MLVQYLQDELRRRKDRNPRYSLRAMATHLQLDPSTLSHILKRKRKLTATYREQILDNLGIKDPRLIERFTGSDFKNIGLEEFSLIADWEHFAIMAVLKSGGRGLAIKEVATALEIPIARATSCMRRLANLGYVLQSAKNRWILQIQNTATVTDIPHEALRECHRQYIQKAFTAIEEQSVEKRDITGVTLSLPTNRLPEAKKMIADFRKKFCTAFESEGRSDEVYRLNIQLFKLAEKLEGK